VISLRSVFLILRIGNHTMRFTVIRTTAAWLLVLITLPARGQTSPQNTFEPRSSPGAGHKFLEKFAGDWSVTKTFFPRSGAPVSTTGRCNQAMIHDGRFLQSSFVFEQDGKQTTGLGIIGFEPESGTFTSFWTDSRQTRMSVRRSKDQFDGKQIVLYSQTLGSEGKDSRRSKTISRLEDDGRKLVHRQYGLLADGGERLVMELVMIKLSDSPPKK
jgi:hypothetical protein